MKILRCTSSEKNLRLEDSDQSYDLFTIINTSNSKDRMNKLCINCAGFCTIWIRVNI